jgi:hypothetical protein
MRHAPRDNDPRASFDCGQPPLTRAPHTVLSIAYSMKLQIVQPTQMTVKGAPEPTP